MSSFKVVVDVVQWAMQTEQLKARVAAENIANASTPGMKAKQVDFAQSLAQLQSALMSGDNDAVKGAVQQQRINTILSNQDVSLDHEVTNLSDAELKFRVLSDGISRQMSLLSLAVNGNR